MGTRGVNWDRRLWAWLLIGGPIAIFSLWALVDNTRLYLVTMLNGLTLASLYFIVASGFTLVFGLMRNVNLAHGSLYLLGGYVGFFVAELTGWWILALAAGFSLPQLPDYCCRCSSCVICKARIFVRRW